MYSNKVECISPHLGLSSPSVDTSYSYDGSSDEEVFSYDHDDIFCKPRNKYLLENKLNSNIRLISFKELAKKLDSSNVYIYAYAILGLISRKLKFNVESIDTLNFLIYNYYFSQKFRDLQKRYRVKVNLKIVQENVITFVFQLDVMSDLVSQFISDIFLQLI